MAGFDTLTDTFDDGTIDPVKWPQSYGDPIEADGRAKVPCTTGYAGLRSASTYTLAGSSAFMRIYPPAAGGAASAVVSIFIQTATGGTDAGFLIDTAGNAVGLYLREGYADGAAVFLTYNPVDHAWLRIREDAGTVYWDTAPDGLTWTNRRTATSPAWASDSSLSIVIEGHRDAGASDYAEIDNFNAPPFSTVAGAASFAASSALAASGSRTGRAAAALTGTGNLAAVGVRRVAGGAQLVADGSLSTLGGRRTYGAVTLASLSTLTAAGQRTARAVAVLAGAGALTVAEAAVDYAFTVGSPSLTWEVGAPWL